MSLKNQPVNPRSSSAYPARLHKDQNFPRHDLGQARGYKGAARSIIVTALLDTKQVLISTSAFVRSGNINSGTLQNVGYNSNAWSGTANGATNAYNLNMNDVSNINPQNNNNRYNGRPVRCVATSVAAVFATQNIYISNNQNPIILIMPTYQIAKNHSLSY